MKYKNINEITCCCCGEKTLGWAEDGNCMSDIPFIWIVCDTCDFEFGAELKLTDCEDILAEFEYYLKGLNNE